MRQNAECVVRSGEWGVGGRCLVLIWVRALSTYIRTSHTFRTSHYAMRMLHFVPVCLLTTVD
jgi:hypothetical protein